MYGPAVAGSPRIKKPAPAAVSWRDGIHLTGTSIWCDAKRSRDICFVSTATALPHARHGQLIATPQTLQLLDKPNEQAASKLAVPFGQPFTLGTQRIELFASGHAYGAASLLVRSGESSVIYAGAVAPRSKGLGGAMDQRSADVLVVSAAYGQSHFVFEDQDVLSQQIVKRCHQITEEGGVSVLLVDGIGKALDTTKLFEGTELALSTHRSFHELSTVANKAGASLPMAKRWNSKGTEGRVVLWPLDKCKKLALDELPKKSRVLLVSGRALDAESVAAAAANEGYAWSNQADHPALVQYIKDSGAKSVFLTHSVDRGASLIEALPGIAVQAIGPPEQLMLF